MGISGMVDTLTLLGYYVSRAITSFQRQFESPINTFRLS